MKNPSLTVGFCVLVALTGLAVVLGLVAAGIVDYKNDTDNLQAELRRATQDTLHNLIRQTDALTTDKSLLKSLHWNLQHAVKQSIANVKTDNYQITIFDKNCTIFFGADNPFVQFGCQVWLKGKKQEQVLKKNKSFGYMKAFAGGDRIVLSYVQLQPQWFAHYEKLQSLLARLPAVTLNMGSPAGSIADISFVYQDKYLNHLFTHVQRYREVINYLSWIVYGLMLAVIGFLLWSLRRFITKVSRDLQQLETWSKQPGDSESLQLNTSMAKQVFHNIGSELQLRLSHLRSARKQITLKNSLLAEAIEENHRHKAQLATKALQISITHQIATLNAYFTHNSTVIRDNTEDLRDSLLHTYHTQLRPLLDLSTKWQQEFRSRRVADFLGAYGNSRQEKYLLQLENDLKQLSVLAGAVYDSLTATLRFTHNLTVSSHNLLQPLSFWEQILVPNSAQKELNFSRVLLEAQKTVQTFNPSREIIFTNTDEASNYKIDAVKGMLISGLYHLYQFFLEETDTPIQITTSTRLKDDRLFVTIAGMRPTDTAHSKDRRFHLEQGRLILQKYHIDVLLSWLRNAIVVSTDSKQVSQPSP